MSSEYGLESRLPDFTFVFVIMGIVIVMIIGLFGYAEYKESQLVYEMPNGVICELKLMKGSGFMSSGSTFEFRKCGDGEVYINPESFKEIRK